ncbi:deoxyribodipyrimidine photo-lyase [Williamsia sp.]|uniref:cryptochrome/photolyase family protein n=1 Tax=Williamsia sp. TaxID=1872085 RepID=UPI001A2E3868|nr:deoxyribodipyrimidine photo-lyase [Williamsia sp.]MBJ7288049.1 deoxyribodipyrimidine photo-lyase [Williamsia sp.]
MSSSTSLLWLRRDLRLADLPSLLAAADAADRVLACFVLDPWLVKTAGDRRLKFLYDSLRELDDKLDGRLLVVRGKPENQIPKIAKAVDANSVHISADHAPYGVARDKRVEEELGGITGGGIELHSTGSSFAVTPGRVTKNDGEPYKVFTPYFRAWREHGWHSPARSSATSADWIDPKDVVGTGSSDVHAVDIPDIDVELSIPAGEDAASKRWKQFRQGAGDYSEHSVEDYDDARNRPDLDASSRMSAYLKFGNIHPRTMLADLTELEKDPDHKEGATAYLRELGFRDFYASVLREWPHSAWHNWNRSFDTIEVDEDKGAHEAFDTWKAGKTGFPIVDAGMRQLSESGFMHNRVRMIVASFLVKDLHVPWQWGARWFLDQLIDGDLASNQHGWQWTAGCGTDASPYFRVFNPTTQGLKFDPSGDYVRRWVPELADVEGKAVHELKDGRPSDYPEPMVDHKAEREEALRRYGQVSGK